MVKKDMAKELLDHNNKHCGFVATDANDLVIYSHHPETSDFGVFHFNKSGLVLANAKSGVVTFSSKVTDRIWIPILRSMHNGIATVLINELAEIFKQRSDFERISDIPEELLVQYGQHEAQVIIIHADQHLLGLNIIDIQPLDDESSLVSAEVVLSGAEIELDLDNGNIEHFKIPGFEGNISLKLSVPADLVQTPTFSHLDIKHGGHKFTVDPMMVAAIKRGVVVELS